MVTPREREMLHAARDAGITSRAELANFMAQISAESGNLTRLEESFNYTRGIDQIPVRWARRAGDAALEDARVDATRGQPEALAELMYGQRMGNDEPGDGYRYRGRGYIQLTGRDNYRDLGQVLDLDLEANPELAAAPEHASRIAVVFWQRNVPAADREDVLAATQRINGGRNGLAHRQAEYERWHAALTPEFMAELDAARVNPVAPLDASMKPTPADPGEPTHPDHAMYRCIRAGVRDIGAARDEPYDVDTCERISRCLLARCRGAEGPQGDPTHGSVHALRSVDHVVLGTTGQLFAIEGRLDDPAQRRVQVSVVHAALVPVEESDRRLAGVAAQSARRPDAAQILHPAQGAPGTPGAPIALGAPAASWHG